MTLPNQITESIKKQMNRPEGTIVFEYESPDLTNKLVKGGNIFEIVTGQQAFILERTDDLEINYYYSSPGIGTSIATIDLKNLIAFSKAFFCLTWSPSKITLSIGPREIDKKELINST